jgi:phosphoribosyl transferase-like protein
MRLLALGEVTAHHYGVDPLRYSRYKYGQVAMADAFAGELARLAVDAMPGLATAPTTVTAPASRAVPIGADLLADGVLRHLNHERTRRLLEPAVRARLHRFHVPSGDYGAQDGATRQALLAAERVSGIPQLFTDRHVVVVDDLLVTGTSAEVTAAAIERWSPASLTYLVIATVEPGYASRYPEVEHDLNHAVVDGLPALARLGGEGPVTVTQRLCKFVLSQRLPELARWLQDIAADEIVSELVWRVHSAALAEGFGLMPAYRDAAAMIARWVEAGALEELAATRGWSPAA